MSKDCSFIFTRYLYEKEEVEIQLLLSIFKKKREDALFWAYELFYSGYEMDLVGYLLKIYYYFYACLNPGFESFLIKKTKELINNVNSDNSKIIASIIENLLIRPLNMDTFFIFQIYHSFDIPILDFYLKMNLDEIWSELFKKEKSNFNIELFLYVVFKYYNPNSLLLLNDLIDYLDLDLNKEKFLLDYRKKRENIQGLKIILDEKIMLISKILYLYGLKMGKKMGKNLYICISREELVMYETIQVDLNEINPFPAYKILPIALTLEINPRQCKKLFKLKREQENIRDAYLNNWLYYASNCPLWTKRIKEYKGMINNEQKKVIFNDEKEEEEILFQSFYDNFGYEPEEQKINIQNKNLGIFILENENEKNNTWFDIYKEYGFKNRWIVIEEDYIEQLEPLDKRIF